MDAPEKRRWYRPVPAWLVYGSLAVMALLFASEMWQWFRFNQHKGWTVLAAVVMVGATMLFMLLWFFASLLFRWRFQFSIRSLLVLTVAVALPFSWLAVAVKSAREQKAVVAAIEKWGGNVDYDWAFDKDGNFLPRARPPEPPWLRSWLGEDFFGAVECVSGPTNNPQVTDEGLAHLTGLPQLKGLQLIGTKVTDQGLAYLDGLPQLTGLLLDGTQVTDAGLAHLAALTKLRTLYLSNTQVSDSGLAYVAGLPELRMLWLINTPQVTDAGLLRLARLRKLQQLKLNGVYVTDEGIERLRSELPNCEIER